eukprot:CCRYP_011197-RA/>CCRYP_011197-RA protein AED:0.00 eAED:0.00 QI:118/1/1/1/1/1/2/971/482
MAMAGGSMITSLTQSEAKLNNLHSSNSNSTTLNHNILKGVERDDPTVEIYSSEKSSLIDSLHQGLISEQTLLREVTKNAVFQSYKDRERLCRQGEMMQVKCTQISFLKSKIEAVRNELILHGKLKEEAQSNAVPAIEEEKSGEFTACDSKCDISDDDMMDLELQQLAGEKQGAKVTRNLSSGSGIHHLSRGSLISSSFSHHSSSSNSIPRTSSSSTTMRFSFFDEVGMPSRWRAREIERKKQLEERERGDDISRSSDKSDVRSEPGNELLNELRTLIVQRESEISLLEEKTKTMELEISSFREKIVDLQKEHEHNLTAAKSERDAILKAIQRLDQDNENLDEKLLETGVVLEEKDMCYRLLEEELREARNQLYELQSIKEASKKKNRVQGTPPSAQPTEQNDKEEQVDMQALLNDVEGVDKKDSSRKRLPMRGSSSSFISALTLDFDDIIDILDASRHNDFEDLDDILDSLTSSKNSSSISG